MYISPNTNIRILQNCPLDNTYDHTIYFPSASAQSSYFQGLTKYTFTNYTYQRVNRGRLRVQRQAEDLYNCNYMMFQNAAFGLKWFYAFITSVEYVNNNTSEISFEIDVMQTWFFDVTLEQCYVEREHVMNDSIGSNLQPEPVELGEYTSNGYSDSGHMENPNVILCTNVNAQGEEVTGGMLAGVYHGTEFLTTSGVSDESISQITDIINSIDSWDRLNQEITACFMYDADFSRSDVGITKTDPASYTITKSKNYSDLDGYRPKNNKLFTYPFNYLLVTTDAGDQVELKYEFFSGSSCTFTMEGAVTANPQVLLDPLNYMSCSRYRNARLILSGFPQCTFNIDAFKAWLAQTASNPSTLSNAITGAVAGGQAAGGWGALIGGATSLINTGISGGMAAMNPPEVKGTSQTDVAFASHTKDFYFFPISVNADYAERIDNFFDVYGYAINQHKVPNRSGRAHWNYVKNKVTNLVANAPADDVNKIVSIYNKGITFWKNGSEVGNYSLDNSL